MGLGGTPRAGSSPERALRLALRHAGDAGARTLLLDGPSLVLPIYDPGQPDDGVATRRLVAALREADGVIVASPAYHGTVSGLVKNALDYAEALAGNPLPYLDGRAFGCLALAHGGQAGGQTLVALRGIAHALRAWPTPMGVAVNAAQTRFGEDGACDDAAIDRQIAIMAGQVVAFARMRRAVAAPAIGLAAE